jgi:hypothetical protein
MRYLILALPDYFTELRLVDYEIASWSLVYIELIHGIVFCITW